MFTTSEQQESLLSQENILEKDVRLDEPWNKEEEDLILSWKEDCLSKSKRHSRRSDENARMFKILSMPSIAIPLVTSSVISMIDDEMTSRYISATGLLLSTILNAVLTTMKFGQAEKVHGAVAGKYSSIVLEIDAELAKPVAFRDPVDQFSLRVRLVKERLDQDSPST
jgi:hypothetical protein